MSSAPTENTQRNDGQGYVVLARRYRPRRFEDVVGQQHVTRTLQNAITADRVHHAYLFTGSRGVGKTTVARILAKALNCEKGPTPTPCEECVSCKEGTTSAVDIYEIDGASHTGVDDVRELREQVRYLPARARRKVYIIDEVHMLSTSAFNALLKTLEEPPPHVVFIFATTEPHKIPATILSRCQRFDFKRVPLPKVVTHLESLVKQEGVDVDASGLALIARASEGSVRDALSLLDQVIAYAVGGDGIGGDHVAEVLGVADRRVLFELSSAVLDGDAGAALDVVARLFREGLDLSQFAQAFLAHLRDLIVVRTCKDPGPLVDATEAELAELRQQAKHDRATLLAQHFDAFARTAEEVAKSSFPRLLLEMVLIEMVHAEPLLPLGDLLERLEALEGRLGGGGAPPRGPSGASGPSRGRPTPRPAPSRGRRSAPSEPAPPAQRAANDAPSAQRAANDASPAPGAPTSDDAQMSPAARARAAVAAATGAKIPNKPRRAPSRPPAPKPTAEPVAKPPTNGTSAPAPSPLASGADIDRWRELLTRIDAEQPAAASAFAAGSLLEFSDDTIELGFPAGSFELTRAESSDKRAIFASACEAQLGRPMKILPRALRPEEESSPELRKQSAMEVERLENAERNDALREGAKKHPVTRALVDDFGATIDALHIES